MIIDIYTKNFALTKTVELPDGPVPRVGETITLEGGQEHLVHNVTYLLEDNTLTPHVECHASSGSINRRLILEENGWL
jgi:hypothetical protein